MNSKHSHSHICGCCMSKASSEINRREFMAGAGAVAGTLTMASLLAKTSFAADADYKPARPLTLKVQPVLTAQVYKPKKQTSWRPWGGLHCKEDIAKEENRIKKELDLLKKGSEFPLEILPLITLNETEQAANIAKGEHDVMLIYAANCSGKTLEVLTNPEKWTIIFLRHKSGPVYLWYETVQAIYLRKFSDEHKQMGVDCDDIVVDRTDEITWRLRALYGLKNTIRKRIVAVGGAGGWGQWGDKERQKTPQMVKDFWKMDIRSVDYKPTLEEMIKKAFADKTLVNRCKEKCEKYLKQRGIKLETKKEFVANAFILTEVFKSCLAEADTDAFTIQHCMGTVMPIAQTTACIPLSLLNDSGYTAYCESDFVVIPSGILLHYISGKPSFLNDPTYPHDGVVTLAHCTAPRKMDGKKYAPARILTHFESDYGAAPKVEMKVGQKITVIDPDFDNKRWLGFEGEIIDNPFLDICRSQIDVRINGDTRQLNQQTTGFHWMACYGNYLKEVGYALNKVGIDWLNLTKT